MSSDPTVSQFARFVRRHAVMLGLVMLVTGAVAVSLYSKPSDESKPLQVKKLSAPGPQLDKFITHAQRKTLPALIVERANGAEVKIGDVAGRLVLVNFWATWCAPCRKEMPQLDALAARYKDKGVTVVTLSVDRSGAAKGEEFLDALAVKHVTRLYDASYKSARAVALIGLPTTLLLDENGFEIGRLAGEADWDAPQVHALLDYYLEN
jgi:thiol-disulfide isomerase/thioredoxin